MSEPKKNWTPTTVGELRRLAEAGLSLKEIGEKLGIPYFYIAGAFGTLGIKTVKQGKGGSEKAKAYQALIAAGFTFDSVAAMFGMTPGGVVQALKRSGLESRAKVIRSERADHVDVAPVPPASASPVQSADFSVKHLPYGFPMGAAA